MDADMKTWIDTATYEQLLTKWRFHPAGHELLQGEVGDYYTMVMKEKEMALPPGEKVAVSKRIGW